MPSEPDQTSIEGLLKSYAKKRAEDAGVAGELHPATRRLLQGEVAGLRRDTEAAGGRSWLQSLILFWPRLATVSAILVMLVTGVWLLLPDSQPSTTMLAQNESTLARTPLPGDRGSREFYQLPLAPATDAPMAERLASEPADLAPAVVPLKRELSQSTSDRAQDEKRFAEEEMRAKQSVPRPGGERRSGEMLRTEADRLPRITAAQEPADASQRKTYLLADAQVSAGASLSSPVPASPASSLAQAQATDALGVSRSVLQAPSATPAPQMVTPSAAPTPAATLAVAPSTNASGGKLLSFRRQEISASGGVTGGQAALNLRFVQSEQEQKSAALKTSPDAGVLLGNFQLLREGRVVRVIDGDGSIYVGQMVDSVGTSPAQASRTDVRNPQFRVTGVHRTTGQVVIFEGSLLAEAGAKDAVDELSKSIEPAPQGLAQRSRSPGGTAPAASASVSTSDRVVGTVRVNGTNIFPVRAISAPR